MEQLRKRDHAANIDTLQASWRPNPYPQALSKLHQLKIDDDDDEPEVAAPRLPKRPSQLKSPWETTISMDDVSSSDQDPSDEALQTQIEAKNAPKKKYTELLSSAQYAPHNFPTKKPKNPLNLTSLTVSAYASSLKNLTGNVAFMNTSTRAASDDPLDDPETPRPSAVAPPFPDPASPTQGDGITRSTALEADV